MTDQLPPAPAPPPAPAWPPPVWRPTPTHPRATLALVLGILSVAGLLVAVTLPLSPLAWYFGVSSMRDIDRDPARWAGRGSAQAGLIMGIIGTVLLMVALMIALLVLVGIVVVNNLDTGYGT